MYDTFLETSYFVVHVINLQLFYVCEKLCIRRSRLYEHLDSLRVIRVDNQNLMH